MDLYRRQELHSHYLANLTPDHDEQVWRFVSALTSQRIVMDWQPGKLSLATLVEREKRLAGSANQNLEWKWYEALDMHGQLAAELNKAQYEADDLEAFMAVEIDQLAMQDTQLKVHKANSFADLSIVFGLQEAVWQQPMSERLQAAYESWLQDPLAVSYFWVDIDGQPVSSAWVGYTQQSQFAGLWAGSTLPDYRGRGCYRALINARAQEAKSRGIKYLTIDAAPSSEPIVASLGFEAISRTRPYTISCQ